MESIKQYDAPYAVASSAGLAVTHAMSAPNGSAQGTAVSTFGTSMGRTRLISGLDVTDANAPGSPPREAPV